MTEKKLAKLFDALTREYCQTVIDDGDNWARNEGDHKEAITNGLRVANEWREKVGLAPLTREEVAT